MNRKELYLFFSYLEGIGPTTFYKLKLKLGSIENIFSADKHILLSLLGTIRTKQFIDFKNTFDIKKELQSIQTAGITIITQEDSRFPKILLNIPDTPICLYVKGNLQKYDFEKDLLIAIVGTRKPTPYGEQITRLFASELAQQGVVIVSGLALGIDAIAHKATLDAEVRTIACFGCGVNIMYPAANRLLYKRILENDGLIISEFPPNMQAQPGLFVQRNRLISGLSKGILVSEGLKDSGSLITARYAAQQGKDVFAPPAPITSEFSEAPNLLLKEGAKLVTATKDILEEYNLYAETGTKKLNISHLNPDEQLIYNLLLKQPLDTDEIARQLTVPIYKILTVISSLEIKGIIVKKGGMYAIY
ncbi:MAG TPA: DNA-processing protein DprA [Candidatus Woesebacteria bacterium]|nr:DNA-processing protein DprA [Candidatus Woesebacteria bacterium]